jgi:hypothetical protein
VDKEGGCGRMSDVIYYDVDGYRYVDIGSYEKLQAELQATKEQLDIAEAVLSVQCTKSAIRYFEDKRKDEVNDEL